MKSFNFGKYPLFNLMLSTTLKELPKLPKYTDNFDYNWHYQDWVIHDGKILYNGSTSKYPTPDEIESLISLLTENDPTLSGVFSLASDNEVEYSSSNFFVSKGIIREFDFNLMFELSQRVS